MEYKYNNIDGIEIDQFNDIMNEISYYDDKVYYMDEFSSVHYNTNPYDLILKVYHGTRFGYVNDSFNPNDKYFTHDGYDNLVSINKYHLQEYMNLFTTEILEYVNEFEVYLDGVEPIV